MRQSDTSPIVSVHMITYNHAASVRRAIESILDQQIDFPIELVIGEDCSTDGTREIVFGFQKKHPDIIRVVTSDENVGARQNSYRTMKACRGAYMAFCEGDDYWHDRSKLKKQLDHLAAHPECGLVFSSYSVFHAPSGRRIHDFIHYRGFRLPSAWNVADIVGGLAVCILTCTVVARRSLCEQVIEADPFLHQGDHFLMGDTQLWAEMSTVSRLHYLPEPLATHNIMEESATRSKNIAKKLRFDVSNAELFLYLSRKHHLPGELQQKYEREWLDYSLRLAFHTQSPELADEVLGKKKTLTWREWLRYYGAHHGFIHSLCRQFGRLGSSLAETPDEWL